MTEIRLATLYDFSFYAFDTYRQAKEWRERVTSRSYMSYWISWLGDYSYTPAIMDYKFRTHNIIIAYQPSKLPDWSTSIMGLMFYRHYYRDMTMTMKNLYIITFMERRRDFVNNGFMHSYELVPSLNRRFMNYFNRYVDTKLDSVYLLDYNSEDDLLYIEDQIEKVDENEAKDMLARTGLRPDFYKQLYKQKLLS